MAVTTAAVVAAGATVYGASQSGKAAGEAADTQAESAASGVAEQRRQFNQVVSLLSPYHEAATGSGQIQQSELVDDRSGDWKPNAALYQGSPEYRAAWDEMIAEHKDKYGVAPSSARGSDASIAQNRLMQKFDLAGYNKSQPQGSLSAQRDLLGLNGPEAQAAAYGQIEKSPIFTGLIKQGETGILQNASATGGLRGGNTQGALAQFRPALLNQLIQQQYSNLGGITTIGQASAAQQAVAAGNTGTNVANLLGQQGAAVAGGQLAQAGIQSQAIGNLANIAGTYLGASGSGSYTGAQGF